MNDLINELHCTFISLCHISEYDIFIICHMSYDTLLMPNVIFNSCSFQHSLGGEKSGILFRVDSIFLGRFVQFKVNNIGVITLEYGRQGQGQQV